jgi:hypothetical protein
MEETTERIGGLARYSAFFDVRRRFRLDERLG